MPATEQRRPDFHHLTPDVVLDLVESALGVPCGNICRPLNSYINRVYEVVLRSGEAVIAKFYRPGRWSREALQDEQDFMAELEEAELPVVAPLANREGARLNIHDGMFFTVYPKKGGRVCDEPTPAQWAELGRLLARVHMVGAAAQPRDRVCLHPASSMEQHLVYILESGRVAAEARRDYEAVAGAIQELIAPHFEELPAVRIHGDCHHQNIIHRPGESFYIIDFDDMAVGPPVQDLWMLLPGRLVDARREVDLFLDGYETFRPFHHGSLALIEPLRAMRFVHYTAWCVRQATDGGFARLAPDWGSAAYWHQEIRELRKQQQEILDAFALFGGTAC